MKRGWLFWLVVAIVVVLVLWLRADRVTPPDQRIAEHVRSLCRIAEHGVESPVEGVEQMFRYYGKRGPAMARDWADLLVLIERIDDDAEHDERARRAAQTIHWPVARCAETFVDFAEAIERDERASALLERGVERLARTIEILLGNGAAAPVLGPLDPRRILSDQRGAEPGS